MQKYDKKSNQENIHRISGYNLVKLNAYKLKLMQALGIRVEDVKNLAPYEAYHNMMSMNIDRKRMYGFTRQEYGISRTNMQNIAKRFEQMIDNDAGDFGEALGGK